MIKIAARLKPFSHTAGTKVVLPGSGHFLTIYPVLVVIDDKEFPLKLTGPVKDFTVQLDLEKAYIKVWGHYGEGFLSYIIRATVDGGYAFIVEKSPVNGLFPDNTKELYTPPKAERLSFGVHKAQDWDLVTRRGDLAEILPFWFRLGQLIPPQTASKGESLLQKGEFLNLFYAGFEGILSPRVIDTQHQGFSLPPIDGSPLALLTEGSKLIRSLFYHDFKITIPSQFHAGRLTDIACEDLGTLDIEWTKHFLRRVVFHAKKDCEINFTFPKAIKSFRGHANQFKQDRSYLFDNFE